MCGLNDVERKVKVIDGNNLHAKSVFDLMMSRYMMYYKYSDSYKDFYCGITCNVQENLKRHNVDEYLVAVKCNTVEISTAVESLLGEKGFDIGNPLHTGNGAADDSKIVYMIDERSSGFQR